RFATRAHHVPVSILPHWPAGGDMARQLAGVTKCSTALTIGPHEIGVAELAGGLVAILLTTGPQVASGEAQEAGRPAGMLPLALQGIEAGLDAVHDGKVVEALTAR